MNDAAKIHFFLETASLSPSFLFFFSTFFFSPFFSPLPHPFSLLFSKAGVTGREKLQNLFILIIFAPRKKIPVFLGELKI